MVAMVQTAATLPFFLLALPSGALADIVDRRRLVMATQIWMFVFALLLGIVTLTGFTTPLLLLLFTFALGLGAAINGPAWQTIIPELVPQEELLGAVTLGSIAFNIARAAGPAIGGLIVGLAGPGFAFLLNAVSYSGVFLVIYHWKRATVESNLPTERFVSAMRTGIRYVRNAPAVRAVFVHMGVFAFFSGTLWIFLPIVAKRYLGLESTGYGVLLGLFGAGGLIGATLLPLVRNNRITLNLLAVITITLFAVPLFVLAHVRQVVVTGAAMALGGICWLILFSSLTAAVQSLIPSWVRGRVLSVFMLIFFGALAGGSVLWGAAANLIGIPWALSLSAACLLVSLTVTWRYRLSSGEGLDLTPSPHWPELTAPCSPELDDGPVLIIVERHIDPARSAEFLKAVGSLKGIRKRDGAMHWNIFRNTEEAGAYVESFIVESWGEYLRQRERMTVSDRGTEERANSFHIGSQPPALTHFIAEKVTKSSSKPQVLNSNGKCKI
jgi:MFS family permease